ncbi:hypothetical protein [Halolamina pelagica]|nr:hypothetical protein [Halolamina pelagica]
MWSSISDSNSTTSQQGIVFPVADAAMLSQQGNPDRPTDVVDEPPAS